MPEFILHGNAEALVCDILTNSPELDEMNVDGISTTLRGYSEDKRWIMVSQEGGSKASWNILNKPRIDVDVRGPLPTSVARDIAEVAEAAIFAAVGSSFAGAFLAHVVEEMGITRIPDVRDEASVRYLFSVRLVCTSTNL